MKIHGQTFMTRQRWVRYGEDIDRSRFLDFWVWGQNSWAQAAKDEWGLSLLGVINGVMRFSGLRLATRVNDDNEIERWTIVRMPNR